MPIHNRRTAMSEEKAGDVWIHFHTSPDDFYPHETTHEQSPMCIFFT